MKTITFIRHAKSDWGDPALEDFQRPLNERGCKNVPEMGRRLVMRDCLPDHILCSSALRTRQTAELLSEVLGLNSSCTRFESALYLASAKTWLERIGTMESTVNNLWCVGHHPGIQDIVEMITGESLPGFPTCGVAHLSVDSLPTWSALSADMGILRWFDAPKFSHPMEFHS